MNIRPCGSLPLLQSSSTATGKDFNGGEFFVKNMKTGKACHCSRSRSLWCGQTCMCIDGGEDHHPGSQIKGARCI